VREKSVTPLQLLGDPATRYIPPRSSATASEPGYCRAVPESGGLDVRRTLTIGLVIMLAGAGVGFLAGLIQGDGVGLRAFVGLGAGMVVAALVLGFYVAVTMTERPGPE